MGASKDGQGPLGQSGPGARSLEGGPVEQTRSVRSRATPKALLPSLPPVVRNTVAVVAVVAAGLTVLSVGALVYRFEIDRAPHRYLMHLFNLDDEGGFQAWYQASTLLACAVLLAYIAARRRKIGSRFARHWAALSALFVAASIDEQVSLHERTIEPLRHSLHAGGLLYFTWVVPGAAIVLLLAVVYWRFLAHLPRRILRMFLVAAALFVGGAMGVEALSGLYSEHLGENNLTYGLITNVEEVLEMAGVLTFGAALGTYLLEHAGEAEISVDRRRRRAKAARPAVPAAAARPSSPAGAAGKAGSSRASAGPASS